MEAIICKSCQSEIHKEAKICPHCRTRQKRGIFAKLIRLIGKMLLIIFVLSVLGTMYEDSKKKAPTAEEKIAKEKRKKELIEKQEKQTDAIKVVKNNLKNPDSFKQSYAGITADGTVCIGYYAKNSFNAVVPGIAYMRNDVVKTDQAGYQKFCDKQPMVDYLGF